jgi:hypothetical protein
MLSPPSNLPLMMLGWLQTIGSKQVNQICSGANPTIAIYNASVVKFYNATGSSGRFENKNILFYFEKRSTLQRWRCSCKLKSRRIDSDFKFFASRDQFHFQMQFLSRSQSYDF